LPKDATFRGVSDVMHHLHAVAHVLGGAIVGQDSVLAPGPGHSPKDRSLSIKLDPVATDGFVIHSFAGDSALACRDYVRSILGLRSWRQTRVERQPMPSSFPTACRSADRSEFALRLWQEAVDPRGTIVNGFLLSRGLMLPDDLAGDIVRYHPALQYNGKTHGGMVTLFRDIRSNTPCGVQRTFLDADGRKLGRAMLGRMKHAAIKIDADENIAVGLTISEGFETGLAARLAGFRPVWAAGSAGGITNLPVLAGVEALTILGEVGDGGANRRASQTCAHRWIAAGQEAFVVTPLVGEDLNDAWREVAQ
jgi:putative DNA primase/helicase